jgi:NAD(P)-dependent dehydrogenase (short-subunit alcohol dehydrogenase family)
MTNVVMTGGTSGIGLVAARSMLAQPGVRLLLGARGRAPDGAESFPLDLTSLASVREYAAKALAVLDGEAIDALVLNAGTQHPHDNARTDEGMETTFVVNHVAQHLLLRLTAPSLAHRARAIITSSSTHDPAHRTVVPPPRHADAMLLAHPERDPERDPKPRAAGGRAYTTSKLCNVLTAQALRRMPLAAEKKLAVAAYDPGPTPGTGLARGSSAPVRGVWWLLGTPLGRLVPRFNTRQQAGEFLARLALGSEPVPPDRYYASLVRGELQWRLPSDLAQDDAVADRLWADSETLAQVG